MKEVHEFWCRNQFWAMSFVADIIRVSEIASESSKKRERGTIPVTMLHNASFSCLCSIFLLFSQVIEFYCCDFPRSCNHGHLKNTHSHCSHEGDERYEQSAGTKCRRAAQTVEWSMAVKWWGWLLVTGLHMFLCTENDCLFEGVLIDFSWFYFCLASYSKLKKKKLLKSIIAQCTYIRGSVWSPSSFLKYVQNIRLFLILQFCEVIDLKTRKKVKFSSSSLTCSGLISSMRT